MLFKKANFSKLEHSVKAPRGPHESLLLAGYNGFNANISFTFQAIKNLYAHPTYLYFGPFCKFFGDFYVYLEINSFSQRISKIYGNRKF